MLGSYVCMSWIYELVEVEHATLRSWKSCVIIVLFGLCSQGARARSSNNVNFNC